MKSDQQILTLNRGVVGKQALARVDVKRLAMSAETQTNFMPRAFGPMMLRPGLKFVGGVDAVPAAQVENCIVFYVPGTDYLSSGDRNVGGSGAGGFSKVQWYHGTFQNGVLAAGPYDEGASSGAAYITVASPGGANATLLIEANNNTGTFCDTNDWELTLTFTGRGDTVGVTSQILCTMRSDGAALRDNTAVNDVEWGQVRLAIASNGANIVFLKESTINEWATYDSYSLTHTPGAAFAVDTTYKVTVRCVAGALSMLINDVAVSTVEVGSWYLFPTEVATQMATAPVAFDCSEAGLPYNDASIEYSALMYTDCGV
jgi:hypothetical protein